MQNFFKIFILNLLNLWILPAACPVMGQARQMKHAAEVDYSRWGTLNMKNISEKGKWISFEMNYESRLDTLFLSNTSGKKTFFFPKGSNGHFEGEQFFAFQDSHSNLQILNLNSFKTTTFKDVSSYELPTRGRYILTIHTSEKKNKILIIREQTGTSIDTIKGITEYVLSKRGDALLFIAENNKYYEAGIICFKDYLRMNITEKSPNKLYKLEWQKEGLGAAFLSETDSLSRASILHYFRVKDRRLFSFDLKKKESYADLIISPREPLLISDDGKKIFFTQTRNKVLVSKNKDDNIEIWNGNDKSLYPLKHQLESGAGIVKKAAWFPDNDFYLQFNDDKHFTFGITGKQDYAVVYNQNPYGLQAIYYEEADFFLKELKSGNTVLLLKKQSIDTRQMKFDPSSNKILYYRESAWWIYDPETEKYISLTRKAKTVWDNNSEFSVRNQFAPYGFAAWSTDGKNILLYDEYDIWLAATDGSDCKRLTKGREKNISFRLDNPSLSTTFSMTEDLILQAKNTEDCSTGYYNLNFKSGEKMLIFSQKKIAQLLTSQNNILAYTSQTYDKPPQIELKKNSNSNTRVLFESNRQQKEYYYGKSELIYYQGHNGEELRAALFYPAGFDPSRKYPMIVYIYDTQSGLVNTYENPTMQNSIGFNITNYTLNDYFVLLPDIIYKVADPGISALESVTAAVDAVVQKGFVDKSRIGLYGHSFGGYETNFIISQTPIFAAAISGAGVSDIISYYFNISKNGFFQSEMWRFESQQYRMEKSLYEDTESYLRNNPILKAEKVTTPLLLWAGKEDRVIPYTQSVSYYLALRRMKKKTMMLLYSKEDHNLNRSSNKANLTKRMIEWFDYYLKDQKTASWISEGTSTN